MHPELFTVFGLPIYSYGFMLVVGFVLALYVASRRAKTVGVRPEFVTDLAIWAILFGIIGARIAYIFEPKDDPKIAAEFAGGWKVFNIFDGNLSWVGAFAGLALAAFCLLVYQLFSKKKVHFKNAEGRLRPQPIVWLIVLAIVMAVAGARAWELGLTANEVKIEGATVKVPLYEQYNFKYFAVRGGGLTFYGGLIPTAVILILITWRKKQNVWLVADVLAPSVMLGLAFGRVGCFLNGCCYGKPASGLWENIAVRFPAGSPAIEAQKMQHIELHDANFSLPVVPTQIIESFAVFGVFLFLNWFFTRRRWNGEVFVLMCGIYAALRFLIEFVRADNPPELIGMTYSQVIGIFVAAAALVIFLYLRRRPVAKGTVPAERSEA